MSSVFSGAAAASIEIKPCANPGPRTGTTPSSWGDFLTLEVGNDDFLKNVDSLLKPKLHHNSTKDFFDNLMKSANAAVAAPFGHGVAGKVCTGSGESCAGPENYIDRNNTNVWATPAIKAGPHFGMLRIMSCNVGADREGRDLVYELAQAFKRPVAAPTYLIYGEETRIYLDEAACWQVAAGDGTKPEIIDLPSVTVPAYEFVMFVVDGKMRSDIRRSSLQLAMFSDEAGRSLKGLALPGGKNVLDFVDFANPLPPRGAPAALITGRFDVTFSLPDGTAKCKHFIIYNDVIAQDVDSPKTFYRIDSRYTRAMMRFREERERRNRHH